MRKYHDCSVSSSSSRLRSRLSSRTFHDLGASKTPKYPDSFGYVRTRPAGAQANSRRKKAKAFAAEGGDGTDAADGDLAKSLRRRPGGPLQSIDPIVAVGPVGPIFLKTRRCQWPRNLKKSNMSKPTPPCTLLSSSLVSSTPCLSSFLFSSLESLTHRRQPPHRNQFAGSSLGQGKRVVHAIGRERPAHVTKHTQLRHERRFSPHGRGERGQPACDALS